MSSTKPFFRIIRHNDAYGRYLPLKVYVDNSFVGNVTYNDYRDFEVEPGIHEVFVKMEDMTSAPYPVEMIESDKLATAMIALDAVFPKLAPSKQSLLSFLRLATVDRDSAFVLKKCFDVRPKKM